MSSMALILGAPDTVPAGNIDRKASNLKRVNQSNYVNLADVNQPCLIFAQNA
jgi:hypothetical protein